MSISAFARVAAVVLAALVVAPSAAWAQYTLFGLNAEGEVVVGARFYLSRPSESERGKYEEYRDLPAGLYLDTARLRLYTTEAHRAADELRPIGVDPTGDHGLVLEFVSVSGFFDADLTPLVDGYDAKTTPDGKIPYTITRTGPGVDVVNCSLLWSRTE